MNPLNRWRALTLALLAALSGVATSPVTGATCGTTKGAFRTVPYPAFPGEDPHIFGGVAVDPYDGKRVVLASYDQVLLSKDSGCSWASVFAVPATPSADQPYRAGQDRIGGVATGAHPAARNRVHVWLLELGGYGRAAFFTSADGTSAYRAATGLPPVGRIVDVATAPSDPAVVYAMVLTGLNHLPTTYASRDGGLSFTRRTEPATAATSKAWMMTVDPGDANTIWANGGNLLSKSTDGGATWTVVTLPGDGINGVTVHRFPGQAKPTIVAVAMANARVYRSDDGGTAWTTFVAPAGLQSANFGASRNDLYVLSNASQQTTLWRLDPRLKRFVAASVKPPVPTFFGLHRENGRRPSFWSVAMHKALVRWTP